MRRSVLVQRVFSVVVLALLLTTLLTTLLYTFISRSIFTNIKGAEILPKARALGSLACRYISGELDISPVAELISSTETDDAAILGAYTVILDGDGEVIMHSSAVSEAQIASIHDITAEVLAGNELVRSRALTIGRVDTVGVGTPVKSGEKVLGAVIMFVPMYETLAGASSLNGALLLSLLIVMPVVVALVYMVVGHIVSPLRQMRDVALAMANGNFNVRADDTQRGEIGQLGQSLNYLSRELSSSIAALTLERNRLKQSVDGLNEGFVSINTLGNITHFNPAVLKMFAENGAYRAGDRLTLINDISIWADFDRVMKDNHEISRNITLREAVIQMTISPITDDENVNAGAVGLFHDITESERLERTRRDYVANVSHELRTPLTAMRGLVEPLRDGMVRSEEARQRYYGIILRETLRLSRLIDDLMELSRLQSGRLSLDVRPVNLTVLIEDLAEKYRMTAEEHGLSFSLLFDPESCPTVMANEDRVEQILVILLDNAMKYTPPGGRLSLNAAWDAERVTLKVKDSGVGISKEEQESVFDRFYKVDRAHSGSGSGLGLSIAREILAQMGETIGVTSESGQGSEFFFTLKRVDVAEERKDGKC